MPPQIQPRLFPVNLLKKHSVMQTRKWHLFDASNQVVGRVANQLCPLLVGKHQPSWTNSYDTGDTVVVVNCEKIQFTGKKMKYKLYRKHSGYPGGLKELTARQVMERDPARILREAVKGMLPKDKLRKHRLSRLKIYEGPEQPHIAQFKIDVRKEDKTTNEIVIPELPNPVHQAMMDYWRGMGDKGQIVGAKGVKIVHEVDLKRAAEQKKVEK